MRKSFVILFIASTILITSTISSASATSGWVKSIHPPSVHHTASNPGNVKICGNHVCNPFENFKISQIIQNHESYFVKQDSSITTKTLTKVTSHTPYLTGTKSK